MIYRWTLATLFRATLSLIVTLNALIVPKSLCHQGCLLCSTQFVKMLITENRQNQTLARLTTDCSLIEDVAAQLYATLVSRSTAENTCRTKPAYCRGPLHHNPSSCPIIQYVFKSFEEDMVSSVWGNYHHREHSQQTYERCDDELSRSIIRRALLIGEFKIHPCEGYPWLPCSEECG